MAELKIASGKSDITDTIAVPLEQVNVHIYTDKGFYKRIDDISLFFTNYLTDQEITAKKLSAIRENILRRAMKAAKYVFEQSPYGKGGEKSRVLRGLQSVNSLLLMVEECVDSDINDSDAALICRDMINQTLNVPPALFDSQNTTLNKGFTYIGPSNQPQYNVTPTGGNPTKPTGRREPGIQTT